MDDLRLLVDLHKDGPRQGPGSEAATRLAVALAGLDGARDLRIADIGCGTGASTLVLARDLDARITAVDLVPAFLARLERAAEEAGLADRITTLAASMAALTFEDAVFDAIWSEGAIYAMGFEAGIRAWRRYLKPGGIMAVSELTWLTAARPAELEAHWQGEYPEVATASAKMAVLEQHGFSPVGYAVLPEPCWTENYYRPMEGRFAAFLARQSAADRPAAEDIVAAERHEMALYARYKDHVGYGFYVARRTDAP